MKTNRKEIEEIFRTNQLGCNGHVMPTIDEWNKIGAHINELTSQVEELKAALEKLTARGVEYLNSEDIDNDEDRATIESNFNDQILESRKLLNHIVENNG